MLDDVMIRARVAVNNKENFVLSSFVHSEQVLAQACVSLTSTCVSVSVSNRCNREATLHVTRSSPKQWESRVLGDTLGVVHIVRHTSKWSGPGRPWSFCKALRSVPTSADATEAPGTDFRAKNNSRS